MQTVQPRSGSSVGQGVLQAIFAVFLGLMITAVVGVGVYTFYPNPGEQTQQQLEELSQRRDAVQGCTTSAGCKALNELTERQRAELESLDAQQRAIEQRARDQREGWAQRTSIILVLVATGLMVVSLILGEALTVLSNGILLGGLFTMLYGVGWGIASGSSVTRFLVLVVALLVSLVLGYLKFARRRGSARADQAGSPQPGAPGRAAAGGAAAGGGAAGSSGGVAAGGGAAGSPAGAAAGAMGPGLGEGAPLGADVIATLGALAERVGDLEQRMAAAAALLGRPAVLPPEDRSEPSG